MIADALTMETDSSSTTVPNALTESLKNSVQIEKNPSITQGDTSNMEGTREKSIDSGKVDEACVQNKSELVPESLEKKMHGIREEDKEGMCNKIIFKFKRIAKIICEDRNISMPNFKSFKIIINDLQKNNKLDEKNLQIKLEEAAQKKRETFAGPIKTGTSATLEGKSIGGEVSDTKEEGEQSISFRSDVDRESPVKSISEIAAVRIEVEAKFEEYRDIGLKYCASAKIGAPSRKRFKEIMSELVKKQQLNVERFKAVLDLYGWLAREEAIWLEGKRIKPRLYAEGGIIIVKKISKMTIEERIAFLEEYKILQATMKDIAVKYCRTIKAPFPPIKWFNTMCRDLYEDGMLDEENIKLIIERDFEERCNLPLNDEQIDFILKRYCADNGLFDIDLKSMKAEILPKMPKKLLCQKYFWNVMYREQKTDFLFLVDELNPVAAKKGTPEDSVPYNIAKNDRPEDSKSSNDVSRVEKNDAKTGGVAAEPKSEQTNQEPITPHNRIQQCKRNMEELDEKPPQRLDEEPIQQLVVQTQQCIAEEARMPEGVDSQESVVSQSLPSRVQSHWDRSNICWGKNQEQRGKGMYLQGQSYVAGERFPKPLGKRDHSQSQPWGQGAMNVPEFFPSDAIFPPVQSYFPERNFSGQTLMIANFTSDTNIRGAFGGQGSPSSQPVWPNEPHIENRRLNSAGMPKDDFFWNSGFGEKPRHQGTGVGGRSQGHDYETTVVGTSELGWSERNQSIPPRENKTNRHDSGRRNNELKRVGEPLEGNLPPPPIIPALTTNEAFRNGQELSCRNKDDDDWRSIRGEPPQRKSRNDEDRQPLPSRSADLQCLVNESKSRFAEDNRISSEPLNPSTSSWRSWGQASPPRIGDQSKLLMIETPPFVEQGKTCKVAIVHEDYPRRIVTDQEAGLIRSALLGRKGVQSGVEPRISNMYEERGAVIFECEDQLTVSWLWVNATTIIPWRSAKLRPTSWENLLKEISIYVPKLLASMNPQTLCDLLMLHNPDLSTESWTFKLSDTTSSKSFNFYFFYIDDESMKTLKSLDFRPHLGYSRVTVHVNQECFGKVRTG